MSPDLVIPGKSESLPPFVHHSFSYDIWKFKYRYRDEVTIADSWERVVRAAVSREVDPEYWYPRFYKALWGFSLLPGGRIIANLGTHRRRATAMNCYAGKNVPDSMEGICQSFTESILTLRASGGLGTAWHELRPSGAPVYGVEGTSSGPLSFMRIWDVGGKVVHSAGMRRGAQLAMQRVDHPNVDQFITAKERNPRIDALKQLLWSLPQLSDEQKVYFAGAQDGTVTGVLEDAKTFERFNISIAITDQFMQAVRADEQFDLIFGGQVWKTVRARELWDLILRHTYEENDPGVAFIDRINELNNLWYCETIYTFNPCGEQPLPPDAVCLLASLNLVQFVLQAFRAGVSFGWVRFREVIRLAVRLLDDVIELSYYPLEDQHQSALQKRRMGLGVTGVGDLFVMMLTRYGSLESVKLFREIMYDFTKTAYHASVDLAIEKGPFPLFDADKYCQSKFLKQAFADHPEDYAELIERIRKHGIRNSHLTSIAPTGTISITANNVSSGIEPIFCKEYDRFVVVEEGRREKIRVMDYAWRLLHELREEGTLTEAEEKEAEPYFVDVESLTVDDHYAILETAARYVDSAVSKTMNIPQGYPFEDFRRFYEQAYDSGVIKGCTTYRSGTGKSVLSRGEVPFPLKQMPEQLPGRSFTCRADGKKWYIHVDSLEGIPVQVFAHTNSKDPIKVSNAVLRVLDKLLQEHSVPVEEIDAQAERAVEKKDQMARWISLALRYGIPAAKVWAAIDEAHPSITTLPWHISHCLKICDPVLGKSTLAESCPECKEKTLIREEGCVQCLTCGYSAC